MQKGKNSFRHFSQYAYIHPREIGLISYQYTLIFSLTNLHLASNRHFYSVTLYQVWLRPNAEMPMYPRSLSLSSPSNHKLAL